jgi:hypothetical protein
MTAQVICLGAYRNKARRKYYHQHRARMEAFIEHFICQNVTTEFYQFLETYLNYQVSNDEKSWDYQDLREMVKDALIEFFATILKQEIRKERWYDPKFLSIEELAERCVTFMILGQSRIAR